MATTFSGNPTTELEAVNDMLLSIGKTPVNTLSVAGINDVAQAQSILYRVTRDVQHRGFWFNKEEHLPIAATTSGTQQIVQRPDTVIDWTSSDRTLKLVERFNPSSNTLCMYDLDKHTFDLTRLLAVQNGKLYFDVVYCFAFEQIPQAARTAIARRAGREFQANVVGSQIWYQFTKEMELDAMAELERSELKNSHTNIFGTYNSTNRAINRQKGPRRTW